MKKRLSILVALIMAFTIFWIPGSAVAFAEGEEDVPEVMAQGDQNEPDNLGEPEVRAMAVYTVSYDANGGSGAPAADTKEEGIPLMLSTDEPTKENCTFIGWNTNKDGSGTSYAAGAEYSIDADVTLYAQWEAIPVVETITVTYNANGGTNAPKAQTVNKGTQLTLTTSKPSWTNHSFVSWNTRNLRILLNIVRP